MPDSSALFAVAFIISFLLISKLLSISQSSNNLTLPHPSQARAHFAPTHPSHQGGCPTFCHDDNSPGVQRAIDKAFPYSTLSLRESYPSKFEVRLWMSSRYIFPTLSYFSPHLIYLFPQFPHTSRQNKTRRFGLDDLFEATPGPTIGIWLVYKDALA